MPPATSAVARIIAPKARVFPSRPIVIDVPMNFIGADVSGILDRILNAATDNLRVAKILLQIGLDPDNVSYGAIFNRLLEIFLPTLRSLTCLRWSARFSLWRPC